MRIVGPELLTVGSLNLIPDPAQGGGNPSAACQIQNSSPYQLTVVAAGDTLSIQPYTAQTVEISGLPMSVTPITATGSGTCSVTFVFLLTTASGTGVQLPDGTWIETPPQQDGPLTAAAILSLINFNTPTQVLPPTMQLSPGGTATFTVQAPVTTRTLIVRALTTGIPGGGGPFSLEVLGDQSGFVYYDQPFYLGGGASSSPIAIVPVVGVADQSYTIAISNAHLTNVTCTVWADTNQYDESVFYNGVLQAASAVFGAAGALTILNGPARLLSCHCEAAAGAAGFLTVAGSNIIRLDSAPNCSQNAAWSFPPATILAAGQSIVVTQVSAGIVSGGVTFAYP